MTTLLRFWRWLWLPRGPGITSGPKPAAFRAAHPQSLTIHRCFGPERGCKVSYHCRDCGAETTLLCDGCNFPVCRSCAAVHEPMDRALRMQGYDLCKGCANPSPEVDRE